MNANETCHLCGLPTDPSEQRVHQHCMSDENIRFDIESIMCNADDLVLYSPIPQQLEDGMHDTTAP
jgi:hypothetical protein